MLASDGKGNEEKRVETKGNKTGMKVCSDMLHQLLNESILQTDPS